jgi:ribosomal protein L25 (general stress protein Ctc)
VGSQLPYYWNETRRELRAWFERNAPSLGELYEGALRMVFDEKFPGRVRFVSHAVREIRNRLPDVIAGYKSEPLEYKNRLDEISKLWEKSGLPLDGAIPIKVTGKELPLTTKVPIPIEVYRKVSKLIRDHIQTREKPKEAAQRLFQAIDPKNKDAEGILRPCIDHWIKITEWFVERAHERGATDDKMGADELKERFEIFEAALSAMLREFFKTEDELDAILEEANS